MLKTHFELNDTDTSISSKARRDSVTLFIQITSQTTFRDNVENQALVLIILVHKFKNC